MCQAYAEVLLYILSRHLKENFRRECAIPPPSADEKTKAQQCKTRQVPPKSGRLTASISGILVGSLWFQTWVRSETTSDLTGAWRMEPNSFSDLEVSCCVEITNQFKSPRLGV